MIVILNNGTRIKIPKKSAQDIFNQLLKDPKSALSWHCLVDTDVNKLLGFNFQTVTAICEEEDIHSVPTDTLQEIGLFLDTLPVDDAHGRYWAEKFRRFVIDKTSTR